MSRSARGRESDEEFMVKAAPEKKKSRVRGGRPTGRSRWQRWRLKVAIGGCLFTVLGVALGILKIDADIREAMEGGNWEVPSVVFAEPVRLYPGLAWYPDQVESVLQSLSYTRQKGAPTPGTYALKGDSLVVHLRGLEIPGRRRDPVPVRIRFDGGGISELLGPDGESLEFVETEAPKVTGFYGSSRQSRDPVRLGDVPQVLKDAVVLVEDKRFREHEGIDLRGIARALWADLRARGRVQGGSTITQQLAKNLFLSRRKTIARKVSEVLYAKRIESLYGKDRILEAYLNEVYLGADRGVQISGVAEGSRHYFGLDVRDIDLPQAALLAGLIRSPGSYDPFRKPDEARARRRTVLDVLLAEGLITAQVHAAADRAPLQLRKAAGLVTSAAAAYVDAVRTQLSTLYPASALEKAGLRIYTPLDLRVQAAAQEALTSVLDKIEERRNLAAGSLQGAVVVVEPGTGAVRALVGGRVARPGDFNRALQARRQPGSLMKPFVYAAALASRRFTPASLIDDAPIDLPGKEGSWKPMNADGLFRGPVTLRYALEHSLNVPSVRLLQQVGYGAPIDVARRCGITSPLVKDYSVVLGTSEVTPIEMAAAFSALASGGVAAEPRFLGAVVSRSGQAFPERAPAPLQALSPQVAFVLNDLLRGVCLRGTASALSWLATRFPLAGKTGTTTGGRDAWFVGYTPKFLALVWVGSDDPQDLKLSGASVALPVWRKLAESISRYLQAPEPEPPPGVVQVPIDPTTGLLGSADCPGATDEWFLEGTEPVEMCAHGILGEQPPEEPPRDVDLDRP